MSELRPAVMTWKAKVIGVEDVPAGVEVGYNGMYVTERPMRLALVSAGYADGFRRELAIEYEREAGRMGDVAREEGSGGGEGVTMNLTSVDVTGIDGGEGGG